MSWHSGRLLAVSRFHDLRRLLFAEARAFGKVAGFILASFTQQCAHAALAQAVKLVHGAQHGAAPGGVIQRHAAGFQHAVQQFPVVQDDDIVAAFQAQRLQRVSDSIISNSASADGEALPTVSASNCRNSRKRPGPGFSLRHTGPVC